MILCGLGTGIRQDRDERDKEGRPGGEERRLLEKNGTNLGCELILGLVECVGCRLQSCDSPLNTLQGQEPEFIAQRTSALPPRLWFSPPSLCPGLPLPALATGHTALLSLMERPAPLGPIPSLASCLLKLSPHSEDQMGYVLHSRPRLLEKEPDHRPSPWAPPALRPSDLLCSVAGSDVEAAQLLVVVILIVKVLQRL